MDKSYSKYSSIFLIVLIIGMAFFSVKLASSLDMPIIEPRDSSTRPGNLKYELQDILGNSLYGIQPENRTGRPLEYYIIAHKYDNQYYMPSSNSEDETQTSSTEEGLVTNFLTSKKNIKIFDPQSINIEDFSGKDVVLVKGNYQMDEGVEYSVQVSDVENDLLAKYGQVMDELIPVVYNIDEEYGILDLSFAYVIDTNTQGFINFNEYINLYRSLIPNIWILGFLCILIISAISFLVNFELTEEIGLFKWIKRFPIELVFFLQFVWLTISQRIIYYESAYLDSLSIYLFSIILIVWLEFAFVYYSLGIKSLFIQTRDSHIFRYSLIINITRAISQQINNIIVDLVKSVDELGSKTLLYVCLGIFALFFIMYILSIINAFVLIIGTIIVVFLYRFFRSFFQEVQIIENYSKEISKGNYEIKIDQDDLKFENISNNLNNISHNLNTAVEEAIKSEKTKSELITNVSHDLKTPLTSILNYSQLIEKEDDPETIKSYGHIIHERSNRLKILIEDLFELTKANTKNIEFEYSKLDFGQLINQVIGEWEDKLLERGLSINLSVPSEKIILNLDGNKTFRVLDNLLSNIYKYSLENTRVYIDLKVGDEVTLEIKNISKYPLNISSEELMERFTRGDESRNTEGSGLGLAIAKSLVEAQSGEFQIYILGDLYMASIKFPYSKDNSVQ